MPRINDRPAGAPCWVDLMSSDTAASRAFYAELLGWTSEDAGPDYGGYINFLRDGEPIAGCMSNNVPEGEECAPGMAASDGWSVYLEADDIDATIDTALANGGRVIIPATPVRELGKMAVIADCTGAVISIWQPGEHKGFQVVGEAGAPGWFELHTRDYDKSVRFYQDVFGWDTHLAGDTDEFRYTTLGAGERQAAGIMDSAAMPDDAGSHWSIYFAVEDTDAALAMTVERGGRIVHEADDTPYGRLATATDPTGALFKLMADTTRAETGDGAGA